MSHRQKPISLFWWIFNPEGAASPGVRQHYLMSDLNNPLGNSILPMSRMGCFLVLLILSASRLIDSGGFCFLLTLLEFAPPFLLCCIVGKPGTSMIITLLALADIRSP